MLGTGEERCARVSIWIGVLALIAGSACSTARDDADPPRDAGGEWRHLPVASGDFSCVGLRTAPPRGESSTFTVHVHDLQTGESTDVANAALQIFPDGVVTPGCAGSCQDLRSDAAGEVAGVMGQAGGWLAYRIEPGTAGGGSAPVLTIGYQHVTPATGGLLELASVSSMTIGFIPSLYRRMRLPGTAIVMGTIVDCAGDAVEHAILRVYRGSQLLTPGPDAIDFFVGYFDFSGRLHPPNGSTGPDGFYTAVNVEPEVDPLRFEVWARTEEGGELRAIACEEVPGFADGVTHVALGPLRSDYAPGSGCSAL